MEQLEAEARSLKLKTEDPPVVARAQGMVLELPSRERSAQAPRRDERAAGTGSGEPHDW